jgi:hypothetical protein
MTLAAKEFHSSHARKSPFRLNIFKYFCSFLASNIEYQSKKPQKSCCVGFREKMINYIFHLASRKNPGALRAVKRLADFDWLRKRC